MFCISVLTSAACANHDLFNMMKVGEVQHTLYIFLNVIVDTVINSSMLSWLE